VHTGTNLNDGFRDSIAGFTGGAEHVNLEENHFLFHTYTLWPVSLVEWYHNELVLLEARKQTRHIFGVILYRTQTTSSIVVLWQSGRYIMYHGISLGFPHDFNQWSCGPSRIMHM
jgi:hypothetical protein